MNLPDRLLADEELLNRLFAESNNVHLHEDVRTILAEAHNAIVEAAAALSGREAVAWTKVRPTEAGIYRVRGWHIGHPDDAAVVEIADTDRGLMCNMHCYNTERDIAGQWGHLSSCSSRFEWSRIDATTPQPGDGVVVPREPTQRMMRAGADRWIEAIEDAVTRKGEEEAARCAWAAMIAAAPSAKGVANG